MKTSLIVLMTCLVSCHVVCGELLNALHALHGSDAFTHLTPEEQVLLVEVIAAAETCKLHAFEQVVHRDRIVALVSHLPSAEEHQVQQYLLNHLHKENAGHCVVNQTARPTTA